MAGGRNKIKVGIDAKWYFTGPPSGHVVVRNLVDHVLANPLGFEVYLVLNSKDKKLASETFGETVKLIFLPGLPNLILNMFLLPLAARRHKMDIVVYQNFSSFWPAKLFKVAYIHDVLFLDMPKYYTLGERFYFKKMTSLARAADMIITISNHEKRRIIDHQIAAEDDVKVVYHGVDESFKPLSAYRETEVKNIEERYRLPAQYILYVGRVNVRKNISKLITAMPLIKSKIQLLIVGEKGAETSALQQQIAELDLRDRVVFTGHVPLADLYLIYARATVFCFPSFAEGFGLPPLEAMKCGVPVVVSNRTAMPEVCGDAAVYINPDEPIHIALKINELLGDRIYYAQKVAAGLKHVKQFTWQRAANLLLTSIAEAYAHRKYHP